MLVNSSHRERKWSRVNTEIDTTMEDSKAPLSCHLLHKTAVLKVNGLAAVCRGYAERSITE